MSEFKAGEADTDVHKCLCCNQRVEHRGKLVTPERAVHIYAVLLAMGYTRKSLLTRHRAQIEFQSPGFAEWLEARGTSQ